MNKRFTWGYIVYLIMSSFFIEIAYQNILLHLLNIAPTVFLLYFYLQHRPKPFSLEDYLVLTPLIIFPISEITIYLFAKEPDEPLIIILNGIYFFLVHICFIFVYRMEGARLMAFANTDYYKIFPIAIATFLIFGFVFLPIIPGKFLFLTMCIAAMLSVLLAHIINRQIRGESYYYGLAGGTLIAITDFFAGYSTFFVCNPQIYTLYRFAYFLGLFCLIGSLLSKKERFALNPQK